VTESVCSDDVDSSAIVARHALANETKGTKVMTDLNDIKNAETLKDLWKELARSLKLDPIPDAMDDVFSEYRGMEALIENAAEEDAERGEMLAQALAIRAAA
jgi:hypothetical protein